MHSADTKLNNSFSELILGVWITATQEVILCSIIVSSYFLSRFLQFTKLFACTMASRSAKSMLVSLDGQHLGWKYDDQCKRLEI